MNAPLGGRIRSAGSPRLRTNAYWAATLLVAVEFGVGGVNDALNLQFFRAPQLGYPAYFGVILGVWKLLGTVAVLVPGYPRLKEWAYAGMIFDLTGAVASLVAIGGGAGDVAWPLVVIPVVAVSWALRPPSRRLP